MRNSYRIEIFQRGEFLSLYKPGTTSAILNESEIVASPIVDEEDEKLADSENKCDLPLTSSRVELPVSAVEIKTVDIQPVTPHVYDPIVQKFSEISTSMSLSLAEFIKSVESRLHLEPSEENPAESTRNLKEVLQDAKNALEEFTKKQVDRIGNFVTNNVEHDPTERITRLVQQSGATSLQQYLSSLEINENIQDNQVSLANLVSVSELPEYYAAYNYITDSYRSEYSARNCWISIFKWHNETLNIWSEFLPALIFSVWIVIFATSDTDYLLSSSTDQILVVMGLTASMVIRPICSGLAHTFYCQTVRAYVFWWGLDYVSICVAVLCSSIVSGRFAFHCIFDVQLFYYLSAVGLFASTLLSVVYVASHGVRAISFVLFVLFANGTPFIYSVVSSSTNSEVANFPTEFLILWAVSLSVFTFGLIVKSTSIPEVFAPGKFNNCGHSHFWWHLCINAGYLLILYDWKSYMHWRNDHICTK